MAPPAAAAAAAARPPSPEERDDEPRLKFQRVEGSVPALLRRHQATRLVVSDKVLALGTKAGSVHVLDYDGNEVGEGRRGSSPAASSSPSSRRAPGVPPCAARAAP